MLVQKNQKQLIFLILFYLNYPYEPIICKYEKRKGKPITMLEGYNGAQKDFKLLAKEIKTMLAVGGSFKDEKIIIQGDYRDKIMQLLKNKGFNVKRVGG